MRNTGAWRIGSEMSIDKVERITIYYTDKPGGFCKRLYALCNGLAEKEVDITFFSLDPELLQVSARVHRKRIPFPLKRRDGLLFWLLFTVWTPLFMLWMLKKPMRAFVFNPYYWALLFPARCLGRVSHITTVYRSVGSRTYKARRAWLRMWVAMLLERISYRWSDRVVTQTMAMHRALSGGKETALFDWRHLPNDIPMVGSSEKTANALPYRCLVVGMFDAGKNLPLVLKVFEAVSPDTFSLTIVGDGPALPLAKEFVRQRGMPHIQFTGWVNDVSSYYERADILLHPSFNEGMPNAILEGYAHNLVVFGSDTEEHLEILGEEKLLFDRKDPASLLKLFSLFEEDLEFQAMCLENTKRRRKVLRFDWIQAGYEAVIGE